MSVSETKTCQNCKTEFIIEPEDFVFYQNIKVPPPTWCSSCRLQRRLSFFNIFNLYKRPCDLCKKDFISVFRKDTLYTVYCPKCWWSDKWDVFAYGRDYDFSRPFFKQFKELWRTTPVLGISVDIPTMETSPYTSHSGHLKNSYLLFHVDYVEDSAYGFYQVRNRSVFDSAMTMECELCYDCENSFKNNRCVGVRGNVTNSMDSAFLRDCDNCQSCFASANLRNKKYHIFNKPYSKEEYMKEMKQWDLGSYRIYEKAKADSAAHWKTYPPRPMYDDFSVDCTGSYVFQSKNCKECFDCSNVHDSKFIMIVADRPTKDCYDISSWGNNMSRSYECCNVGEDVSDARFCQESGLGLMDAEYCKLSTGAHHLGCVSMKKGDYVIFNKRYSKEEHEALRKKIIRHMDEMPYIDKKGRIYRYGEFFPTELSPFAYNETLADGFFPLSKEGIADEGYRFAESEEKDYTITKPHGKLPDHIRDVGDDILKEVIDCATCGRGYKVIPMELSFLKQMNLPLPRKCPFCRVNEKFKEWVGNLSVVPRTCDKCGIQFTTNYTKKDAPHIFCKKCYQSEVV
ncbi:MAG: hypothetical protein UW92_C0009G0013 [Candidatus Jorgensenbacteria bacterium GW2011_GWA2_45_13]|uniref:Uncharacterized protein n=1 Tax=Candidatus Jorgensenbacteria bacterium GW2011_GWA2_45_13 TaxID=1618662 RepID=A0A0G1L770_9BACT|nr:MAG: hypothetical protein UW92_C0009G0013 [Candidatus Jorgensenbacteria bacterium GW2011_GWA2_45_13]